MHEQVTHHNQPRSLLRPDALSRSFPNRYERGDLTSLVRRGLVKSVVSYGVVKKTFYGLTERGRQAAQKEASK